MGYLSFLLFLTIGVIVFGLSSIQYVSAQAQQTKLTFVPYSNPTLGIQMNIPVGWHDISGHSDSILLRAPLESFGGGGEGEHVILGIDFHALPSMQNTLDALTKYQLADDNPKKDKDIIQHGPTMLGGLPAYMITKNNVYFEGNFDWRQMEIWTIKGSNWYDVLYLAEGDKYEQYLPIVNQIIKSLKFTT